MRRRVLLLAFGVISCFGNTAVAQDSEYSLCLPVTLDEYRVEDSGLSSQLIVPEGHITALPGEPALPWKQLYLADNFAGTASDLQLIALETDTIRLSSPISDILEPIQTRGEISGNIQNVPGVPAYPAVLYPPTNLILGAPGAWKGQAIQSLSWCPFIYHPEDGILVVIRRGEIRSKGSVNNDCLAAGIARARGAGELRDVIGQGELSPQSPTESTSEEIQTIAVGVPLGIDYVIVTSADLVDAFRPLAKWRQQLGYRVGIATVDEITAAYPGEDTQAKIREYLRAAYNQGLQFCVLGGDETIVPIRYAYHSYADVMPSYEFLQICDLYYSDFTGDWDTDGDGIYGEYLQDNPDVYPEIYLGRLPVASADQATALALKIITYEKNPGNGDPSYVTRGLFSCADQMRDWNGGQGQHEIIAANFPGSFTLDMLNQSENPSGSEPAPLAPEGVAFVDDLSDGWGWTTVINHGRTDGFVLRSAGLNQWPKSYIWSSGSDGDGHGHLNLLDDGPPGIFLSVSCDLGGFDMDGPLFNGFYGPNIAEQLLQKPNGGAVAMIAFSRWGWVSSSYRIFEKFAEYAFDPEIEPQIGVSFALAKTSFPYYRDQNFGLNLLGDPAMPHWRNLPQMLEADFPAQVAARSGAVSFKVFTGGNPVSGVTVSATYNDTIFFVGRTDADGSTVWSTGPDRLGGYTITISKPGFMPVIGSLVTPITSGITDEKDQAGLAAPVLQQNHPNPFNPTTTIEFVLPAAGHATVEVYDILGRRVNTLLNEYLAAGTHEIFFSAEDRNGAALASGVYFYRLQTGTHNQMKKMVLLR